MTRTLLVFIGLLGMTQPGCTAESHLPSEPVDAGDAGPTADGGSDPRVEPVPSPSATCARHCEACAPSLGFTLRECLEGCEARHRVAIMNGCEDRFVGWSDCIADACDEVARCNDTWRGARGSCF